MRRVGAIVLAAGMSRRMGSANKLLIDFQGKPLVRWIVDALASCDLFQTLVITGHESDAVRACLSGCDLKFAHADDYPSGISASIRAGIEALDPQVEAVLICLGDMPAVRTEDIQVLLDAYASSDGQSVHAPAHQGQRGHPVLWPRRYFGVLSALHGDQGARALLEDESVSIALVEVTHAGVLRDVDRPEDFRD